MQCLEMHACRVNVWVSSIYVYILSFYYKLMLFLSQTSFSFCPFAKKNFLFSSFFFFLTVRNLRTQVHAQL